MITKAEGHDLVRLNHVKRLIPDRLTYKMTISYRQPNACYLLDTEVPECGGKGWDH